MQDLHQTEPRRIQGVSIAILSSIVFREKFDRYLYIRLDRGGRRSGPTAPASIAAVLPENQQPLLQPHQSPARALIRKPAHKGCVLVNCRCHSSWNPLPKAGRLQPNLSRRRNGTLPAAPPPSRLLGRFASIQDEASTWCESLAAG